MFSVSEKPDRLELVFHVPKSSNALSLEAARELARITRAYKKWRGPVVMTSGHPRLFCSGGNLSDYARLKGKAPGLRINREITRHLDLFGAWPATKYALIDGDVLGGGMEWLARFDFRWCTPRSMFAFWQKRIGLTTGWGGGHAWAEKIGEERVRQLLTEARLISAGGARELGLVDRIIPAWRMRPEGLASAVAEWSVKSETKVFASLWMGPKHQAVLKKWR